MRILVAVLVFIVAFLISLYAIGFVIDFWLEWKHPHRNLEENIRIVGALLILIMPTIVSMKAYDDLEKPEPDTPEPKCPKCNSVDLAIIETRYDSYHSTRTVTKRVDHYNSEGDFTGHSEHDEEEPHTDSYPIITRECKSCSNKWTS